MVFMHLIHAYSIFTHNFTLNIFGPFEFFFVILIKWIETIVSLIQEVLLVFCSNLENTK